MFSSYKIHQPCVVHPKARLLTSNFKKICVTELSPKDKIFDHKGKCHNIVRITDVPKNIKFQVIPRQDNEECGNFFLPESNYIFFPKQNKWELASALNERYDMGFILGALLSCGIIIQDFESAKSKSIVKFICDSDSVQYISKLTTCLFNLNIKYNFTPTKYTHSYVLVEDTRFVLWANYVMKNKKHVLCNPFGRASFKGIYESIVLGNHHFYGDDLHAPLKKLISLKDEYENVSGDALLIFTNSDTNSSVVCDNFPNATYPTK